MEYGLPKSIKLGERDYKIRYDYRVIIDIILAITDVELSESEKAIAALLIFYVDWEEIPSEYTQEALDACMRFINGGLDDEKSKKKSPKLVDWEKDYTYIVAPVNRILGTEIRAIEYDPIANTGGLHWFTFLSAYMEIGDCVFSQIVSIRDKRARGKKLSEADKEFYKRNADLVDIKQKYTEEENDLVALWTKGG